jgi:N-carbamoyl-L-amino-acid hydrolase
LPPVMTGSHLDSVLKGGAYDGVVGVVGAIEAVRLLKQSGFKPLRPIDIVVFMEEEGTRFGQLLLGSKAWTGQVSYDELVGIRDNAGVSYIEAMEPLRGKYPLIQDGVLKSGSAVAMFELHIEQSSVLAKNQVPIGIVTGIAGAKQLKIRVRGVANHGGATPMRYRADAMAGVAEALVRIEQLAREAINSALVVTCGYLECLPGAVNVIPGEVIFTLDIRGIETTALLDAVDVIQNDIQAVMQRRGLDVSFEELSNTPVVELNPTLTAMLASIAQKLNIPSINMSSGAVHDTAILAKIMPAGMIFVPSHEGRSHCQAEHTEVSDIAQGVEILAAALAQSAGQ